MATSYVFVVTENGRHVGVARVNPPGTGGTLVDSFEHDDGASTEERLRQAAERNGPLRVQIRRLDPPQPWRDDSQFPATTHGLDEACMLAGDLSAAGVAVQIVTGRGVSVKQWPANAAH